MDKITGNEPISKLIIKQFLPDNPVILEAGAHNGRDTLKLLKIWPLAHIYAFEPVPDLFTLLKAKTANLPMITCIPIALSNTIGTAPLHVSSGRSTAASSLLKPKQYLIDNPTVLFNQTVPVNTTTIDSWAQESQISTIDFLWLDMQGAELQVLKAATSILKTVKIIYTEINLSERYEQNALYRDLKKWLEEQDFSLYQTHMVKHNWGNALFIRTSHVC